MARVDLATGLLFFLAWSSFLFVSAHPPQTSSAGTSFKQGRTEVDPWRRHGDQFDEDLVDLVQDDWSVGFGRRLSVIQRRQGSPQEQFRAQLRPKEEVTSATTTTTTAIPIVNKAEAPSATSIVRLIRKRLPENRSPSSVPISGALGKLVNATVVNETVQPAVGEVTEESFVSAETVVVETRENVASKVVASSNLTESPQQTITSTTTTTTNAPTSTTLAAVTTTTATTTTTTSSTTTTLSPPSNKPPWRVRMELNQSNRRGQSTTGKPTLVAVEAVPSLPDSSISTTISSSSLPVEQQQQEQQELLQEVKNSSNLPVITPSTAPSLESSQSSEQSFLSSIVAVVTLTTNAPNSRPIQSSRITITSSLSPPPPSSSALWTPIVRLPVTGSRNIPAGTLKIQITSTRLPPLPATSSTPNPKLLESLESIESESREEENVVKTASFSSTTSGRIFSPSSTTTTTTTTTTTEAPTTTSKSSTTRRAPPTPIMHTLEDILQRLVPARDHDSFGGNPFLVAPVAYYPAVVPPTADDTNEIVSIGAPVLRASTGPAGSSRTVNDNLQQDRNSSGNSGTNWNDSTKENQTATTSIYVVGVVAVIPLAGLVLWIVRVQLHKRRERLNESETSSETGFRKRLPPVALTPSKHARLFYGANDKEDLVSGAVSLGNSGGGGGGLGGGGKSSPSPSPWEFTRSRLRLQTLIGEGNFGQVWKAEAEDICGCQGTLLVAVKTVKDGAAAKEKQELLREMRIMQQVGPHPNVVALLGCCTEQEPFLLIMEYVMYGRLLTFLRDHRTHQTYYNYSTDSEALTSRDLTTFAYCVAKGMEYIYSKGVVHRDLAARNVLVDHNKLCKVADFGLSRSVRDSAGEMYEQRVKGALPIRWMAPESLIQSVFTQKSDVWSFGILVWEIVTLGSTPYPGMEAREVMRRVKDGHRLERPSHCRPEFYRLMSRCWHSDPQRRPDFGELKSELGQLLDDADGYIDLDSFQESIYVPLQSPSDESEKI
uniref:receptor protein-tyrosine kinase n=1 Tax=Daphnia galeata TaxID=27404 RepID=A0A8J2S5T0_9CRUS|nr:unnamed protein product [Daphnia galeata]